METTTSKSSEIYLDIRNVSVSTKTKQILYDVNASTHNGNLLAIMGPSGSGKTTLLNAVAGRVDLSSGRVTLNGELFNKQLRRCLGYVLQDDAFMSRLTLYETLYFTAMIRIPEFVSHDEKCRRIEKILEAFDLRKCKDTVIGDMFVRGLSGGEKKRANIACELITDPDIMLLDEPTSGLDSSTAHSIMKQLCSYATKSNKTIITTIHQPSSHVFHMFSTLLLLMDGHVAYFGEASAALKYFEKMGLHCDMNFNPADFLLDLMKSETATRQKILHEAEKNKKFASFIESHSTPNGMVHQYNSTSSINIPESRFTVKGYTKGDSIAKLVDVCKVDVCQEENMTANKQKWPTSFRTQYRMLSWRQFKQSKGHILHKYEVVQAIIMAIVAGTMYFQTDFTYRSLRDKMGMVSFSTTYWGFNSMINSITSFPAEREVIRKERQAGSYRLSALYCAKMTSDIPLVLTLPIFYYSITFWMSSMGGGVLFVIFMLVNLLHCCAAQSIGQILGAGIPNIHKAIVGGNTYMLSALLLSGYFNFNLPKWLHWAKYFSILHYPFAALNILSTDGMPDLQCNTTSAVMFPACNGNTTSLSKDDVLKDYGIDAPYFCYISMLGILIVVLRIIGYYVLRFKK